MTDILIVRKNGRDYIQDPETGKLYPAIQGAWEAVAIGAVLAVTAISTYMQVQSANQQAEAADAQAAAEQQRAAIAIQASQIEARGIQERAEWEAQASKQAAEYEIDVARKNAEFEANAARELALLEAKGEQERAEFEARTAAEIAALESERARMAGRIESGEARRRAAVLLGKRRALAAAAGYDLTSGSPLVAEMDHIINSEIDALNISRTAEGAAITTTRAAELRGEAGLLRAEQARVELTRRADIVGGKEIMRAVDIGTGARLEAELRVQAIKMSAESQVWSTLFKGRVQQNEALYAASMAKWSANNARATVPWIIAKGAAQAASSGMSAYKSVSTPSSSGGFWEGSQSSFGGFSTQRAGERF